MKLLNLIESLLNCLYLAAELWDWLEKHLSVFGIGADFSVTLTSMHLAA
jgi:hypothetical protein